MTLKERIEKIKERADQGGRRLETAMAACEQIEALCDDVLSLFARTGHYHWEYRWRVVRDESSWSLWQTGRPDPREVELMHQGCIKIEVRSLAVIETSEYVP